MGSDFIDPTWATIYQTASAIGLLVVAYHYIDTSDPAAQAQTCAAALDGADVPVMFDFEDDSGDFDNFQAVLSAFQAAGLNVALSYIPEWYWEDIDSPDISGVPGLVSSAYPGGSGAASTIYTEDGGDDGEGWDGYGARRRSSGSSPTKHSSPGSTSTATHSSVNFQISKHYSEFNRKDHSACLPSSSSRISTTWCSGHISRWWESSPTTPAT
jgi:hypothetical protein